MTTDTQILILYPFIGLVAALISKWEKKVNVASTSVVIAAPAALLSAAGTAIFFILAFKGFLLLLAIGFMLISKMKFIIGTKVAAIFASLAATIFGVALGPIGWVVIAIALFIFIYCLREVFLIWFKNIYNWFLEKFARFLMFTRQAAIKLGKFCLRH